MNRDDIGLWGIDDAATRKNLEKQIRDQTIDRWHHVTFLFSLWTTLWLMNWLGRRLRLDDLWEQILLAIAMSTVLGVLFKKATAFRRRRAQFNLLSGLGRCTVCGYDLEMADQSLRCPECGHEVCHGGGSSPGQQS